MDILDILEQRGFVNQCTDMDGLRELVATGEPLRAYIGFDLTAPSLHVGSLIQIMVLRWMLKCGHQPAALLGTSTTMVGDPTGRSTARPMLSEHEIDANMEGIKKVISRIAEFDPENGNGAFTGNWWHKDFDFLGFMRKYGRHFSANRLLALDAIKSRVESKNGISVLEMIYPMMQAVDFYELNDRFEVMLQIGGSDQWGNITSGVDLTRRMRAAFPKPERPVFGLTTPLFTNSAGEKMGKTANGAIWLDPALTSVHDFFQFWMNIEDSKVEQCLKLFTELPLDAIEEAMSPSGPGIMEAKRALAIAVTDLVHGAGEGAAESVRSRKMFEGGQMQGAPEVIVEGMESPTIASVLVKIGLASSNKEADRLVANGGVKMNGVRVENARQFIPSVADAFVLSVGKRAFTVNFRP